MTEPTATDEGQRTVMRYLEQIWEASREMVDAYKADTGADLSSLPAWSSLTQEQIEHFYIHTREVYPFLAQAMESVVAQ